VDVFGNLTVVGSFFDSVDFNSGIGVQRIVAQSTLRDGFVCRLDANGDLIWVNQLGGIGSDEVKAVSVDNTGNVVVAGTFEGTVDFDPGVGVANLTSSGMQDVFIVKYHTSGSFLWAKQVGGAWADIANSLSIDIENSIYCAGEFEGVADFDPSTSNYTLNSKGKKDGYALKLDSNGNFIWAVNIGGTEKDVINAVVTDSEKNVFVGGYFTDLADFDPSQATHYIRCVGAFDAFVTKLDSV